MKPERKVKINALALAIALSVVAANVFGAADDLFGNIGDVQLKGYLGERLDAMIANHVAGQDVDYITATFQEKTERNGWWQTEFWGKWMHSAMPYLRYREEGRGKREEGIGNREEKR
jgi:hypothetical protein